MSKKRYHYDQSNFICLSIYSLLRLIFNTLYIFYRTCFRLYLSQKLFSILYCSCKREFAWDLVKHQWWSICEKRVNILKALTISTKAPPWVSDWVKSELLFTYLFAFLPLYIDVFNR